MIKIYYILLLSIIFLLFLCFFYRKECGIKYSKNIINSPSYGKIIHIDKNKIINNNRYVLISIFLNIYDIHYQYIPIDGKIINIQYDNSGKFNLAYNFNKSNENEKMITTIKNNLGTFYVYQIAGKYARRIVHYNKIYDDVTSGDIFGLIKLGSRVDILLPYNDNLILYYDVGNYVEGGKSILAKYL